MEKIIPGVVLKQEDKGEYDKQILLFTPEGMIPATMKGVKKNNAKLRFGALPFAFAEYSLARGKHGGFTVTGCSQIEDLSDISANTEAFFAASFISESTIYARPDGGETFAEFLKSLKSLLYDEIKPLFVAIHYCQYLIHTAGYGYEYTRPESIARPLDLLYYTRSLDDYKIVADIDDDLFLRTFSSITSNFEKKFDCKFLSKDLLQNRI